MLAKEEKSARLAKVARMYYIENKKQSDISDILGVSRPFISRMLQEARDCGMVEITIHEPSCLDEKLFGLLSTTYGIKHSALASDGMNDTITNANLSKKAFSLLETLGTKRLGIGWGHLVGEFISYLERQPVSENAVESVCPLVGNAGISVRNYQSNENVRIIAEKLNATPHFIDLPCLPADSAEKELLCSTSSYRLVEHTWQRMDTAYVNIGNFPSIPDFASGARYGTLLQQNKACGRLIAYFYNELGEIVESENDFALQIPIQLLQNCPNVVGLCSANTSVRALRGALETRLFTHIVARKGLVAQLFE